MLPWNGDDDCEWRMETTFDCGDGNTYSATIVTTLQTVAGEAVWTVIVYTGDYPDGTYYTLWWQRGYDTNPLNCTYTYYLGAASSEPAAGDPDHCSAGDEEEAIINPLESYITCPCCDSGNGPAYMTLVVEGMANDDCADCDNMNGTYILLEHAEAGDPCAWKKESYPTYLCGEASFYTKYLYAQENADGRCHFEATFTTDQCMFFFWGPSSADTIDCRTANGANQAHLYFTSRSCGGSLVQDCDNSGASVSVYGGRTI